MKTTQRRCFISYAHEGMDRDTLDYFLFVLRDALGENIQLLLDQQLKIGEDFAAFMALLDDVDAVIILLTPSYRRKVVERQGGVYEEYRRIWARFSDQRVEGSGHTAGNQPAYFEIIPILFSGNINDATPSELKNLKQLDLTGLRAIRKPTGEFQVAMQVQQIYSPKLQELISQIRTVSTVNRPSRAELLLTYNVTVELTIDRDFDSFSTEDKARVLRTLKELLDLPDEISVIAIGPGSTKLTITLTCEQAEQLLWLYERGVLDDLKIKDAKVIGSETADAIVRNKSQSNTYDVFMCHNSGDKPEVKRIALRLRNRGILPWLDECELRPGLPWQQALEEQIGSIKSAAIFVGNSGIGPWQNMELNAFIRQFVQRQCPVIPVILKTCPCVPTLPPFLDGMTWISFKKGKPNPYNQLVWGITGRKQ